MNDPVIKLQPGLPDSRHQECKSKTYSASLPKVSVIISFFDEHWPTLIRTVKSVLNRSPENLLEEIILVNDFSTRKDVLQSLDFFLRTNGYIVQVVHLSSRRGVAGARMAGAERASGQVLVFMDAHCEVGYNWLPPLLEPIAEDYRTVMIPAVDDIDKNTFEMFPQDPGKRGAFDWEFNYRRLDAKAGFEEETTKPTNPYASPVVEFPVLQLRFIK